MSVVLPQLPGPLGRLTPARPAAAMPDLEAAA